MKKFLILSVILVLPLISMAQTTTIKTLEEVKPSINTEVAIKKVETISVNPKSQNLDLNFQKSNDIISIKAYIKSLQLKSKDTVMS